MTDLVRINTANGVGLPVTLADGSRFILPTFVQVTPTGVMITNGSGDTSNTGTELDTDGNIVPTYKANTFTYDSSGNLVTTTVTDGTSSWVKTLTYTNGQQTADSGWVKQ